MSYWVRAVNTQSYHKSRMILRERVLERMKAAGLSQAELARRVGVSQPTIFKLIHSSKKGSAHLHRIARELGTTPAYLSGEVDNPAQDAPEPPKFTREQVDHLSDLQALAAPDRAAILRLARSLANLPVRLPDEDALADMFEGLLMTMNRTKPLDEQARLLAQRLPIALSQLQDLLPPQPIADQDEAAVVPVPPTREAVSS